jgi:energy-coupling factor transport system substrate-specific component
MQTRSLFKVNPMVLFASVIAVAAMRILMAPAPNIEPVMLFTLTAGLALGPLTGFVMGAGSLLLSNILLAGSPLSFPWIFQMPLVTLYTSLTYGAVGVMAGLLGNAKKRWGRIDLTLAAAGLTVFYDLVTCICFALQFYGPAGIPLALESQVPFTLLHLSNAVFAFVFGPYVLRMAQKAGDLSITRYIDQLRTYW